MKVLVMSASAELRELMALATGSIERRLGEPLEFLEASDGERAAKISWRERPDVVVADEIASRAGAFALAKDLRGAARPFGGVIVILLDRPHDAWLARWSGADAWFVKPADPFELADRIVELVSGSRDAGASGVTTGPRESA
ncbi:MAG: hypothetical protein HY658_15130 [Actinobacteria bacterium]|nr:hypothetical protein [Actinomycetota bacterium]